MRETVWGLGLFSRITGNATVKRRGTWWSEEGTLPVVVRGDGELRLAVAGDRVDAGARGSLEAGVRTLRDRVKVHQVPEVEGPQVRAVARILGARGPPIRRPGCRVGVRDNQDGCRVNQAGDLPPDGRPPSHIWLYANVDLGGMGRQHMMPAPWGEDLHEEGVRILLAPEEGRPGSCPGADIYFQARPRLALGREHGVPGVVLEGGVLRACPGLGLSQEEEGGAARCHVQGLRKEALP